MKRAKSVREVSTHKKVATNIRVTLYDLDRSREVADRLQMSVSDYFRKILGEANARYSKRLNVD